MGCGKKKYERIRTIKPNKETYLHIGVKRKKGKRGGRTEAIGKPHHEDLKRGRRL